MNKTLNYRAEIDGLRALAVLAVFFYHLDITLFKGGFVGVDIFFVISGFLITKIISTQMAEGRFSFAEFYARRVKRIFPALFAMLALTTVVAILFLLPTEYRDFMHALRHAALQFSNIIFVQKISYFQNTDAENPLLHTWSLGVEEQFYLVWPLLFWCVVRFKQLKKILWVLVPLAIVSFVTSLYLLKTDANQAFYLLHSRAWELALGGIVALIATDILNKKWVTETLGIIGIAFMLGAILGINDTHFPGVKALLPVFGAALTIYAFQAPKANYVVRFFRFKPLVFVGLISYSLYLWHWPLIAFYKDYTLKPLTPMVQLFIFIASMVLAGLSWRFIEQPFRNYKNNNYKKIFGCALALMLIFVLLGNALKEGYKHSWRYIGELDRNIFDSEFKADVCVDQRKLHSQGWCVEDVVGKKFDVLFVGDSHTGHYTKAVAAWAKQHHYNVRYITRAGCPVWFIDQKSTPLVDDKIANACMADQKELMAALKHKNLKYIIMALRLDMYLENNPASNQFHNWRLEPIKTVTEARQIFEKTVINSWQLMRKSNNNNLKLVFLGQVPVAKEAAIQCNFKKILLGSLLLSDNFCPDLDKTYSQQRLVFGQQLMQRLTQEQHVIYFDPAPYILKFKNSQGDIVFRDNNHLNNYGAQMLVLPLQYAIN